MNQTKNKKLTRSDLSLTEKIHMDGERELSIDRLMNALSETAAKWAAENMMPNKQSVIHDALDHFELDFQSLLSRKEKGEAEDKLDPVEEFIVKNFVRDQIEMVTIYRNSDSSK